MSSICGCFANVLSTDMANSSQRCVIVCMLLQVGVLTARSEGNMCIYVSIYLYIHTLICVCVYLMGMHMYSVKTVDKHSKTVNESVLRRITIVQSAP